MEKELIIIGHKNPDTDTVVSSLVLAYLLKKAKNSVAGFSNFKIKARRTGNLNKETRFILSYFQQKTPLLIKSIFNKNVFLVDHGEYKQSVRGIEKANILGVLDHHKMGGIKTPSPIFYRAEPLGSTSTIIAKMFFENDILLDKKRAGLLLAAILSDTLRLTSPTTTNEDKKTASILVKISKENINKLSKKMFEVKSDISGISPEELVSRDYKEYEAGGVKFGFGVCETTSPKSLDKIVDKIFFALDKFKKRKKIDLAFFALIDILKKDSKVFLLDKEKDVASKVFKKRTKGKFLLLPGVVSRKKQLIPPIIKFLEK